MITGSIVALITPFDEDGNVSYDRLAGLVEWHISEKTDGILVLGTTAETPTLTDEEEERIVRKVIAKAGGRVPVIAGSGSNNTQMCIEKSLKYQNMGADALLVITPYYNKTNKEGLFRHFTAVADAVDIPVYIYNVPGRTSMSVPFDIMKRLSRHKNIAGVKEASGDMSLIAKYSTLINEDFNIYSGNDDITVPVMSMGGAGTISVLANILPGQTHEMAMAYWNGETVKAAEMQKYYLDFINKLFIETNPIPIKEAMNMAGMDVGGYRLPLWHMNDENKAALADSMRTVGLLK